MNVYTCNDHVGHGVGAASVIVAENELQAYELLRAELIENGLNTEVLSAEKKGEMPTFKLLDVTKPQAIVLQNGDY